MTGIKLRICRKHEWLEVDADEVLPDEWPQLVITERRYGRDGWQIAQALATWIRQRLSEGR